MSKCLSTVCDREETPGNRGYCQGHYRRWRLGQPIDTPLKAKVKGGAKCTIVDINGVKCKKNAVSGGLCPTHNGRKQRGTDLYAPVRDYIQTDDLAERLNHYAPPGSPNECWEWTGCRNKEYGMISVADSKLRGAHIVAWELANGESLPEGAIIRHSCDNPPCTNPAHLLLGTHQDNVADKVERGRQGKGETHSHAKLTNEIVLEICRLYDEGMSQTTLADRFGIGQNHVSQIVCGDLWGHVTGRKKADRARHIKLSLSHAREIRRLYREGGWTYASLAESFGVSRATVNLVLSGKAWPEGDE